MHGTSIELQPVGTNGKDGTTHLSSTEVTAAGNGDGGANGSHEAAETDVLLSVETPACNGETNSARENESSRTSKHMSSLTRMAKELNKPVYKKIRLWMVIVFIVVFVIAVALITPLICSALYVDPDDTFDRSSFNTPLVFTGSFKLPNVVSTAELLNASSSESRTLAANLQEKLSDLFRSSPALGRYFSSAELPGFRHGSVIADYQLTFLMPEQEQEQLSNFTLSREVVFNVFRQFLYDQEPNESEPMYIDPVSLNMTG